MSVKRIVSVTLAVLLIAALSLSAGCKGGDSGNTASGSKKPVNAEDVYGASDLSEELIGALQNSGEISMYTMYADTANGKFSDEEKAEMAFYKDYYGLTIKYRYQVYGDDLSKFLVDFAAKDAPDTITLDYRRWPKAGLRQIVYNTDELKKLGLLGLDHPAITRYADLDSRFNIGDKIYGLSVSVCVPVVCGVNLDLFDQYKIKSPVEYYNEGAWNMDNYIKCAKEMTRTLADGTKIWGTFGWNYNWYLVANDARLVQWDKNYKLKLTMNDPLTTRTLEKIQELYVKGYTPIENEDNALWKTGKMGMCLMTSNNMALQLKDVTYKWDIVPMPYGDDNKSGETAGEMDSWGVVTGTKNPQGVINYLIAHGAYADYRYGKENGLKYRPVYEGLYNDDQLEMIYSYCDKIGQDLVMGVGTLGKSYKFWNDLRDGGMTLKECIDTYEGFYQEQIDSENSQAK